MGEAVFLESPVINDQSLYNGNLGDGGMGPFEKGGRYGRERMYFRVVRVLKNAYYQFGISSHLRTGPTGNATLFNQWRACVYQNVDPEIKIFSQ